MQNTGLIGGLAWVALVLGYVFQITGALAKFKCWFFKGLAENLHPFYEAQCPAKSLEKDIQWGNDVLAIMLGNTLKWDSEKSILKGYINQTDKDYIIKRYYPYWVKRYNGEVAMAVLTCINLPTEKGGVHTNFTFEDIYKN